MQAACSTVSPAPTLTASAGPSSTILTVSSTAGIKPGMGINSSVSGFLVNEAVASVNSGTSITLTQAPSGSASSATLYLAGDGGSVIMDGELSATPTCFQRIGQASNILQWGAVADAPFNNASSGTDNDPFISAALSYLENQGGGTIYFPSGNGKAYGTQGRYNLSSYSGINIACTGSGVTMIEALGTSTLPLFIFGYPTSITTPLSQSIIGGGIQGCSINANGITNFGVEVTGLQSGTFRDLAIENALQTNLDIEDGTGGYAQGATLNNSFDGLFIDSSFHTNWSNMKAIPTYTALGIDINDNTATLGCYVPQACNYDAYFSIGASSSSGSTIYFPVGVSITTAIGAVVVDTTTSGNIPTGAYVTGCSPSCKTAASITMSSPVSVASNDNLQFQTGHNYAVRQTDIQNCKITASQKSAAIRVGYGNGDVFGCVIAQQTKGVVSAVTATGAVISGSPTLTFSAGVLNNLALGSAVSDSMGYIQPNTFITGCSGTPCASGTSATMSLNAMGGTISSMDTITFDATNTTVFGNPVTSSQQLALSDVPANLWIGDAVKDLDYNTMPAGEYVLACNVYPCSAATSVTLAIPMQGMSHTNDRIQFSTSHYSVELQGAPIGLGTGLGGNGPAWHEFFYGTQTGPGTVRCENLFRLPMSAAFPNSGICENDVFVVQNSDDGGFGTIAVDPGAYMLMCHDTGDCIGDVHVGELYLAGAPNYDSQWHSFSEALRSQFFAGTDLPGITAVGDTANPALGLWDSAAINNTTIGVNANSGDMDVTTGVAQASGVALKVAGIAECASDYSMTLQYLQCASTSQGGNVLVTVSSTASLKKLQTVTITGVNGVAFGNGTSAICNADVSDQIKILDSTHFYLADTPWFSSSTAYSACTNPGNIDAYSSGGIVWSGNMTVQLVAATADNSGLVQYSLNSTAPMTTASVCTANGITGTYTSANVEEEPVFSIDNGTTLTLNAATTAETGTSGGFIACRPLAAPQNLVANQGVAGSNYGNEATVTGVSTTSTMSTPSLVELQFPSGKAGPLKTGQWISVSGSTGPGVNGLHPITDIDSSDVTLADLPYVSGATYGSGLTVNWLDPVITVGCSGQTARVAPPTLFNLDTWGIYCSATNNTFDLIRNDGVVLTFPGYAGNVIATTTSTPAQGDLAYYNGTNWVDLGAGSSGQYLQTEGGSANPIWASTKQALTMSTNQTQATGTTSSYPLSGWVDSSSLGATSVNQIFPFAGTFKNLNVQVATAPGGSDSIEVKLLVGGTVTPVHCTISGSATMCADTAHTAAVGAAGTATYSIIQSGGSLASKPTVGIELDTP